MNYNKHNSSYASIDIFQTVKNAISRSLIENLFPGGKWSNDEYWICSPLRPDKTPDSFSISIKQGKEGLWNDFATKESGDLIDLVSRFHNISKIGAAKLICEKAGISTDQEEKKSEPKLAKEKAAPVIPIPDDALPKYTAHIESKYIVQKYGKPVKVWGYNTPEGKPWCIVVRHEKENGEKNTIPYYFGNDGKWHAGNAVNQNRWLFNVEKLKDEPALPALVVEGEKCASAEVSGYTLITWSGGAKGYRKTDFAPLYGRTVYLWPDNDKPGRECMQAIAKILIENRSTVFWIEPPADKPQGWDIADAAAEGEDILKIINAANPAESPAKEESEAIDDEISVQDLLAKKFSPRKWFLFFTSGLNLIFAKKAIGKTYFCIQLAKALSEGTSFLNTISEPVSVLYISTEIDSDGMQERLIQFGDWTGNLNFKFEIKNGDEGLKDLENRIKAGGYKVVFIDMLLPLIPDEITSKNKLNDYATGNFYLKLRKIGQRNGCAIVVTWHSRKAKAEDDFLDGAAMSMALVAQSDVIINLSKKNRTDSTVQIKIEGNHAKGETLTAIFDNYHFDICESSYENKLTPNELLIISTLEKFADGATARDLAEELAKTSRNEINAISKALQRLKKDDIIERPEKGLYRVKVN